MRVRSIAINAELHGGGGSFLFSPNSLALYFWAVTIYIKIWLNNHFKIRMYNSISFLIRTWIGIFTVLGTVGEISLTPLSHILDLQLHIIYFPNTPNNDCLSTSWCFLYTKKICLVRVVVCNWHYMFLNNCPSFFLHYVLMRARMS